MADMKYGRIFTESDLQKILEFIEPDDFKGVSVPDVNTLLDEMDDKGIRFKWEKDEPVFVLRARDKTAEGAVRYYRDRQRPGAPANHLDGVEKAYQSFHSYRVDNPELMKDPD